MPDNHLCLISNSTFLACRYSVCQVSTLVIVCKKNICIDCHPLRLCMDRKIYKTNFELWHHDFMVPSLVQSASEAPPLALHLNWQAS